MGNFGLLITVVKTLFNCDLFLQLLLQLYKLLYVELVSSANFIILHSNILNCLLTVVNITFVSKRFVSK